MLSLILAESALELVPPEISRHVSVKNDATRRGVEASRILLDRSLHHAAMVSLDESYKRGRPDLLHLTLLTVTSTPLFQEGKVKIYIHTRNDEVLEFAERTRPPKSYFRFRDLMQKALYEKPSEGLIKYSEESVSQLIHRIRPDLAIGLSVQGKKITLEELALQVAQAKNAVILVGGFPKGHFTPETVKSLEGLFRVDASPLDAHVVIGRLVYEVEKIARK